MKCGVSVVSATLGYKGGIRRRAWSGGLALLAAAVSMSGPIASDAGAEACPNEERRAEQGAAGLALPDCRAYELASPGGIISQEDPSARASLTGDAITYSTTFPAQTATSSAFFYLAERGANGWVTETVAPQNAPAVPGGSTDPCDQNVYFSADLTQNIDEEGWFEATRPKCKEKEEILVPGEPALYRNVFLHDVATGSNQLLNLTPEGVAPANAKFQDASDDFTRILFSEEAKLTPEAPAGYNLFMWEDGEVRLVSFLPDGTPVAGQLAEGAGYRLKAGTSVTSSGLAPITGAVSSDGRRVFFYSGNGLYLRLNADQPQSAVSGGECTEPARACTIRIDQTRGPGASNNGNFWRANSEATRVFFSSDSKLTTDSTASSGKADLYEYDVETDQLVDLTVKPGEGADLRGVSGASEDGSHLYFVANGALTPGAVAGKCRGTNTGTQTCNLYLAHEGSVRLVAVLHRTDRAAWQESGTPTTIPRGRQAQVAANVSPSGRFFAFTSIQSLTGYDNRDIDNDSPTRQIFLYDAAANGGAGQLSCVSCIPSGARPDDPSVDIVFGGEYGSGTVASWKLNTVLDDGRVFFDTEDGLLAQDTNERADVYEYHAGELRLLSTGSYAGHSRFVAATPDGSDVFFRTAESLVPSDTDKGHVSLYDARVEGGFPEPSPPQPPCEGESCRDAVPLAPLALAPGTSTFQGLGTASARPERKGRRCARSRRATKRRRCGSAKRRKQAQRRASGRTGGVVR